MKSFWVPWKSNAYSDLTLSLEVIVEEIVPKKQVTCLPFSSRRE
jgi:hypothetical protein